MKNYNEIAHDGRNGWNFVLQQYTSMASKTVEEQHVDSTFTIWLIRHTYFINNLIKLVIFNINIKYVSII